MSQEKIREVNENTLFSVPMLCDTNDDPDRPWRIV